MATPEHPSTRDKIRLGAAGVLFVLLALFVLKNTDETNVDFVVTDVEVPLIFVLIGTAVTGAVASSLVQFVLRRRRRD
jgi:uncharacterized integral membrane protein